MSIPQPETPTVAPFAEVRAPECAQQSIPREAADDYDASVGQVATQLHCHLIAVGRRTTRAYDRNLVAVQK
jgi:hypothetical protein